MFSATFFGVRGTLPMAAASHLKYGGNTSCIEVRCGARRLILDAGTGIHELGKRMEGSEADILLSHTHIDHILGLPFFQPAYQPGTALRIWAGHLLPQSGIKEAVSRLISPPLFPLTLADLTADIEWKDFTAGDTLNHPAFSKHGIEVRTTALNHPDRATGYRITYAGHSLCYLTDLEHQEGVIDSTLVRFIANADLLIYDSTYDDRYFAQYRGWGHSTWQQAVRLADAAGVRGVAVFHHDPAADDATLDSRAGLLASMRPSSFIAREGTTYVFQGVK